MVLPKGQTNNPEYYVLGHSVSEEEEKSNNIFDVNSNRANSYLDSVLSSMNINELNCRYNKLIKYYVENTYEVSEDDYNKYIDEVLDDIIACNPKIIVGFGSEVAKILLGDRFRYMKSARGRLFDIDIKDHQFKVLVTYSPNYITKSPDNPEDYQDMTEYANAFYNDINYSARYVNGDLVDISDKDLRFAKTYDEFKEYFDQYLRDCEFPSYDIESNAKDPRCADFRIVGYSLAPNGNTGIYVIRKTLEYEMPEDDWQKCVEITKEYLMSRKCLVHNIMYEKPATLNEWHINITDFEDSLIKARLLLGGKTGAGLKDQCILNLGYPEWDADLGNYITYFTQLWNDLYPTPAGNNRWDFDYLSEHGFRGLLNCYEEMDKITKELSNKNSDELSKDEEKALKDNYIDDRSRRCMNAMLDLIPLISTYYDENEIEDILELVGKELINLIEIRYSGMLPYSSIPMKIITKYGAMDSVGTHDLNAFLSKRMDNESTETVNLWNGYRVMKEHFIVGSHLEMNGLYWDEEVAKSNYDWLASTAKESLRNCIMSGFLDDQIINNSMYLLTDEIVENRMEYVRSVLGDFEMQKSAIKLVATGKRISYKNLIWELPQEFIDSMKPWVLQKSKELIMDDNVHKTFEDLKYIFNPASNKNKDILNKILVTDEIKIGYIIVKIRDLLESEEFTIESVPMSERLLYSTIQNIDKYNKSEDCQQKITQRQLFEKVNAVLSQITVKCPINERDNGSKLYYIMQEAYKYKLEGTSEPVILKLFDYYEAIGIDIEDESTYTDEFRFLYNFRMYKKCTKLISSYIDGSKIGRGSVWTVKREDIDQNKVEPIRLEKYDWNKPKKDDEEYLMQPTWKVCFTGDTKVKCLDGNSYSFKELVDNNVEKLWVYSCKSSGEIVPALARNIRKTRSNAKLVKVILDNGEEIRCTPYHQFMLRDGSYKEAQYLNSSDNLMPYYLNYNYKIKLIEFLDYTEDVYDLEVPEYHNFALDAGVFVHNCTAETMRWQSGIHCLHPDTKIRLTDGRNITVKELKEEFDSGKNNYVYSRDEDRGQLQIELIRDVYISHKTHDMVRVYLDNGEYFEVTPDHKMVMRDGSYRETQDLKVGDSLYPINIRVDETQHELIFDPDLNEDVYCHYLSDDFNERYGLLRDMSNDHMGRNGAWIRHHFDFNPLNNDPSNVNRVGWNTHDEWHKSSEGQKRRWERVKIRMDQDEDYYDHMMNVFRKKYYDNGLDKYVGVYSSENMRKKNLRDNADPEYQKKCQRGKILKFIHNHPEITVDNYDDVVRNDSSRFKFYKHSVEKWFDSLKEAIELSKSYNHNIIKIEKIYYDNPIDVYSVAIYSKSPSFSLSCGVMSKNTLPMGRVVKGMYTSRYKGGVIAAPDYSQLEVRITAGLSHCTPMLEAYKNGEDVHLKTAMGIFGKPADQITKVERRFSKMGCRVGSSKVKLLDGTIKTMKEIYDSGVKDFYTYSFDLDKNEIVPGHVVDVQLTKYVKKLRKLTFSNGFSEECTEDHLYLCTDGEYRRADELEGHSIETLFTRIPTEGAYAYCDNNPNYYEQYRDVRYEYKCGTRNPNILHTRYGKWNETHIMVAYNKYGSINELTVDHVDNNSLNNDPSNIQLLSSKDNRFKARFRKIDNFGHFKTGCRIIKSILDNGEEVNEESFNTYRNIMFSNHHGIITWDKLQSYEYSIEELLNIYDELYSRNIEESLKYNPVEGFKKSEIECVTCVKSEVIEYEEEVPVYDLSVETHHNYAAYLGDNTSVFTHNTFRILYGSTPEGFARQFLDNNVALARQIFDGFYNTYPEIKEWMDKRHREVEKYGKVSCENVGYFINIDVAGDPEGIEGAYRKAGNYPVQSQGCFTGSTKVKMLDGTYKSFEELTKDYSNKKFWVYSIDDNNQIVPGLASNPHITKYVDKLVRVTLDNGEVIECTDNHLFMLRSGDYIEAGELLEGDSLMPLYTRLSDKSKDGLNNYEMIKDPDGDWVFTHRRVTDSLGIEVPSGKLRHHADFNKYNNCPENLVIMTPWDHQKLHKETSSERVSFLWTQDWYRDNQIIKRSAMMKERWRDPEYRAKRIEQLRESGRMTDACQEGKIRMMSDPIEGEIWRQKVSRGLRNNSEHMKELSETMSYKNQNRKELYPEWDKNQRDFASKLITEMNKDPVHASNMKKGKVLNFLNKMLKVYKISEITDDTYDQLKMNIDSKYRASYSNIIKLFGSLNEALVEASTYNHKVVKVEIINLEEKVPVYDLYVEDYHNFALASGVFVHNSMTAGYVLASINNYFMDHNLYTKPISFIHDSLEFDIHPKELFEVTPVILRMMNDIPRDEFDIFTEADVVIGTSMGMENEIKKMEFSDDSNEAWMTLEGFEDDLDDMYNNWKYNAEYRLVEYEDIGDPEPVYTRKRELFQEKLALGPFLGKTRNLIQRKFHIIMN